MDEPIAATDGRDPGHQPVLMRQVLDLLQPRAGQVYVDCTLGRGGHAEAISRLLGPAGHIVGLDLDEGNLEFAGRRLRELAQGLGAGKVDLRHGSFGLIGEILGELSLAKGVDLLLADLGFASTQMDDPERGFSFSKEGPLDMRMDQSQRTSAYDLVNGLREAELADLIYQLGEERLSRPIARKIIEERRRRPINSTVQLAEIVRQAYGRRRHGQRIDPATRTFMALRIAVNGELDALGALLESLPVVMAPGGVAAIISFHSLEDRLVKQAFVAWRKNGTAEVLTPKPVVASDEEAGLNPRSRSAKLRAIRWLGRADSLKISDRK
ncbi:MAG: 16S rRNA (cytosine(1402)-N(4))-methyltransferase RsmH [Phycisphaeraceae bacterium]|nr:16S rRNA (cytosine(1402)-N(4))-methyltransferase RsmH [Phycisphaeraceae bacterium]